MNNRSTINGFRVYHEGNFNEKVGHIKNLYNGYEYYYPVGEGYFEIFNVDMEVTPSSNDIGYNSNSKVVFRTFATVTTSADDKVKYGQIHIRIANHLTDTLVYRKEEITIENGLFKQDEVIAVRDETNLVNGIVNYKVYVKLKVNDSFLHINLAPITRYLYKATQNNSERNYITSLPSEYIKASKTAPHVKYIAQFGNDITLDAGENTIVFDNVQMGEAILKESVKYTLEDNKIYLAELDVISYDTFDSTNEISVTFWRYKKEDGNRTTYNRQNAIGPSISATATLITNLSNQFAITINCLKPINVKGFSTLKIIELGHE